MSWLPNARSTLLSWVSRCLGAFVVWSRQCRSNAQSRDRAAIDTACFNARFESLALCPYCRNTISDCASLRAYVYVCVCTRMCMRVCACVFAYCSSCCCCCILLPQLSLQNSTFQGCIHGADNVEGGAVH